MCVHLKNKKCDTKCLACKLFTCKYLKERGVKIDINDCLIINVFLNKKQQETLTRNLFKSKEDIIKKLLEDLKNKQLYPIFYLKDSAYINEN